MESFYDVTVEVDTVEGGLRYTKCRDQFRRLSANKRWLVTRVPPAPRRATSMFVAQPDHSRLRYTYLSFSNIIDSIPKDENGEY